VALPGLPIRPVFRQASIGIPGFVIYLIRNSGIAQGVTGLLAGKALSWDGNWCFSEVASPVSAARLISILSSFGLGDL
jgi:hypothetical protein